MEVQDEPDLDITAGLTVATWIFPISGAGGIVTKLENAPSGGFGWAMAYVFDQEIIFFTSVDHASTAVQSGPMTVPYDQWSFVVGTSDGTSLRIYVNGHFMDSAATAPIPTNDVTLLVGAFQRHGIKEQFFDGNIEEVSVYSRVLSEEEIMSVFCAGISGKCQVVFSDGFESGDTNEWSSTAGVHSVRF